MPAEGRSPSTAEPCVVVRLLLIPGVLLVSAMEAKRNGLTRGRHWPREPRIWRDFICLAIQGQPTVNGDSRVEDFVPNRLQKALLAFSPRQRRCR